MSPPLTLTDSRHEAFAIARAEGIHRHHAPADQPFPHTSAHPTNTTSVSPRATSPKSSG